MHNRTSTPSSIHNDATSKTLTRHEENNLNSVNLYREAKAKIKELHKANDVFWSSSELEYSTT